MPIHLSLERLGFGRSSNVNSSLLCTAGSDNSAAVTLDGIIMLIVTRDSLVVCDAQTMKTVQRTSLARCSFVTLPVLSLSYPSYGHATQY